MSSMKVLAIETSTYSGSIAVADGDRILGEYYMGMGPSHSEKLIPKVIHSCAQKSNIPVYGTGSNIRDWLHVSDHAECLLHIASKGKVSEIYNIGANNEYSNIFIVKKILLIISSRPMGFTTSSIL